MVTVEPAVAAVTAPFSAAVVVASTSTPPAVAVTVADAETAPPSSVTFAPLMAAVAEFARTSPPVARKMASPAISSSLSAVICVVPVIETADPASVDVSETSSVAEMFALVSTVTSPAAVTVTDPALAVSARRVIAFASCSAMLSAEPATAAKSFVASSSAAPPPVTVSVVVPVAEMVVAATCPTSPPAMIVSDAAEISPRSTALTSVI